MLLKIKRRFYSDKAKMSEMWKTWHGWAQPDTYPDCSGKLETVEDEEKTTREKAEKLIESKQ